MPQKLKAIVLREISREEALQEVKNLLSSSPSPLDHNFRAKEASIFICEEELAHS